MPVSKKEKEVQEALGLYDPLDFFIGGLIPVEFVENTPQTLIDDYRIRIDDTAYVDPENLEYPIKDSEDFLRKVIAACKKR